MLLGVVACCWVLLAHPGFEIFDQFFDIFGGENVDLVIFGAVFHFVINGSGGEQQSSAHDAADLTGKLCELVDVVGIFAGISSKPLGFAFDQQ